MWHKDGVEHEVKKEISTHTSRVGCDLKKLEKLSVIINFYSHIPCGMWLLCHYAIFTCLLFLLTHPVWDVTRFNHVRLKVMVISTHTSRVGCDDLPVLMMAGQENFYSHIPCGMWPNHPFRSSPISSDFYSHIPCGMWRDWQCNHGLRRHFYSHIPCGMWPSSSSVIPSALEIFLLTHPVWDVTTIAPPL